MWVFTDEGKPGNKEKNLGAKSDKLDPLTTAAPGVEPGTH